MPETLMDCNPCNNIETPGALGVGPKFVLPSNLKDAPVKRKCKATWTTANGPTLCFHHLASYS